MRRISVADLGARTLENAELDWFFNEMESSLGLHSNFMAMLGRDSERTFEDYVEAARRRRRIRDRLVLIPDSDAGVLQCAYEQRAWPDVLVRRFGRLTGVIVRLACALDRWPSDRALQRVVEMARAEWLVPECVAGVGKTLGRLRTEAAARFSRASTAYEAARRRR
jgi:hypothetical protein